MNGQEFKDTRSPENPFFRQEPGQANAQPQRKPPPGPISGRDVLDLLKAEFEAEQKPNGSDRPEAGGTRSIPVRPGPKL